MTIRTRKLSHGSEMPNLQTPSAVFGRAEHQPTTVLTS